VWYRPLTLAQLNALLRQVLRRAEVDRAVIFGVLTKIWQSLFALITVWLIASYFTPELQGYYYTFVNLLALQVFMELGLGIIIIQFASHEWSKLGLDKRGRIVGDPGALSRLVSLGRFALCWYSIAGGILSVGLVLGGYFFFSQLSSYPGISWVGPWLILCLLTAMKLCFLPFWSLLEGCNQVSNVYFYRFINAIVIGVSLCAAIMLRVGLWAAGTAVACELVWSGVFLFWRYRQFFNHFLSQPSGQRISWWSEIWQMQWRIALSWLSGYFIFSLFTPATFYYYGAAAAGQMGMTWSLVSGLSGISSMWVLTKVPRFGVLIAQRKYEALDRLFFRSAAVSFIIACLGAIAIWVITYFLHFYNHPLSLRLLPSLPTGLFLLATVLMQISYPQSAYLRAHKKEPFLTVSVFQGILTALSTLLLGSHFGATGMAVGYLGVIAFFVIPYGTVIWLRRRAEWHNP